MADDAKKPGMMVAIGLGPKLRGGGPKDDGYSEDAKSPHEDMERSAMDQFIAAVHKQDCEGALDAWHDLQDLGEPDGDEGPESKDEN
jgi:hypothetical protein